MSAKPDEPIDNPQEIAERVRSGEYFRDIRNAYAAMYLDPISGRYFYLCYSAACAMIFLFILISFAELFPLSNNIPFIYRTENALEEKPRIISLRYSKEEPANMAIKRFMVSEYVRRREAYDFNTLELNVRFVKAQSAENVYNEWQATLDPKNPSSPIAEFQRHSTRRIEVTSTTANQDGTMEVAFDSIVEMLGQVLPPPPKVTHMIATLAFQYTNVTIDSKTGHPTPLHFVVTDYRTQRVQE